MQEVPIRSFSVAVFVCREVEEGALEVLLIRRDSRYLRGTWQMVSGALDEGETAWQGALRETREETGIVPDRFYSANHLQQFYEARQNCINLVPVFVAFIDTDQPVVLSDEHDAYLWVPYKEVGDHVAFPEQARSAQLIYEQFVQKAPLSFLQIDVP